MWSYIGWGSVSFVVAAIVGAIVVWIGEKVVRVQQLCWDEEQEGFRKVNLYTWLTVFPVFMGLALWFGPPYTAELYRQAEADRAAYIASLPLQRVTVTGTELVFTSERTGRSSSKTYAYGLNVTTKEFPAQKIFFHSSLGMNDLRVEEELDVRIDDWQVQQATRHGRPQRAAESN